MVSKRHLYIVLMCSLLCSCPVSSLWARTLTVDDGGSAEYATIKDAVETASEGDTVAVRAGTYKEWDIVLKEGMVLQGAGADRGATSDPQQGLASSLGV